VNFDDDMNCRYSDSETDSIPDVDEQDYMDIDQINKVFLSEDQLRDHDFINDVIHWTLEHSISYIALKKLLLILNKHTQTTFPK